MVCLATFSAFMSPINEMLHRDVMHHNPVEIGFVMGFPLGWSGIYLASMPVGNAATE
jgi:hypothetical protein